MHDTQVTDAIRVVQMTPPGSSCAIVFGTGMGPITDMAPGSVKGLHLVVEDMAATRAAMTARGIELSDVDDRGGQVKHDIRHSPRLTADRNLMRFGFGPEHLPSSGLVEGRTESCDTLQRELPYAVSSMQTRCQRVFRPSSRHLRCPRCRSKSLCSCGRAKQRKSVTCGDCRSESMEANSNWKGGRSRHKAGYVVLRVPGHPRTGRHPYVFEHILVAEELLGRYLLVGDTVHHRNGVREDSRPENLELWTRPQPAGIRVSDAIAWAPEIIERYESDGAPPTALTCLA